MRRSGTVATADTTRRSAQRRGADRPPDGTSWARAAAISPPPSPPPAGPESGGLRTASGLRPVDRPHREIAYHLADSDAKAYFAFEGTPELPIAQAAWEGFGATEGCTEFFLIESGAAAPGGEGVGDGTPESYAVAVAEQPATFRTVERDEDDTAVVLYTSGTTGHPKGAELRHRNVYDNALIGRDLFASDPGRPDTYLCVLPLFHAFGQTVIQNGAFGFGGTIVMQPRFEARAALRLMLAHDVTFFAGVSTMYRGLLAALDETVDVARLAANLRVAVAGGAALPAEIHKQFKDRFGVTILEGYGLSETSPIASFSRFGEEPRVGSIGVPVPGVEMRLIRDDWSEVEGGPDEIGEIAIKGHNVMKGYYKRPERRPRRSRRAGSDPATSPARTLILRT
ncbi:AMP-binding protein [Streptomyces sp. NBC_00631]|uniref:AMP-binding protein n=1 Tax=Streptomyces sp. NBC_00631 TaxID=2975793 RepID=UPI0030E360EA